MSDHFDSLATNQFADNPLRFLKENFVLSRGYGFLHPDLALRGKRGAPYVPRHLGGAKKSIDITDPRLAISDSEVLQLDLIKGRNLPTAFVGLKKGDSYPYIAHVQADQDDEHPLEVLYLTSSANQMVGMELPRGNSPKIALTDPLSGCTMFVSECAGTGTTWWHHANALAVRSEDQPDYGRIYMRNLWRRWAAGTDFRLTHMLDLPYYNEVRERMAGRWKDARIGRADYFGAFALRDDANKWCCYWQSGFEVELERTGLQLRLRGPASKKVVVTLHLIPGVPNPFPNP